MTDLDMAGIRERVLADIGKTAAMTGTSFPSLIAALAYADTIAVWISTGQVPVPAAETGA